MTSRHRSPAETHVATTPRWGMLFGVLAAATLIRGGVLWFRFGALDADIDGYRWLAESLSTDGVYGAVAPDGTVVPTAFRPPLYPWLLSWLVFDGQLHNLAVALLHLALGVATVGLTFRCGRYLGGVRVGILGAILVAIDPILLVQSTQVMTETLAAFLAIAAFASWLCYDAVSRESVVTSRARWSLSLLIAACLAAGFLCRPTFIVWAALLVAWQVFLSLRTGLPRHRFPLVISLTVVMGVVVGAWTFRNQQQLGHPIWATTHGGYTLLLGNNPSFYQYLEDGPLGHAWDAEPFHRAWTMRYRDDPRNAEYWRRHAQATTSPPAVEDEVTDDQLAYEAARATIDRQPAQFVYASLIRIARLWNPLPLKTAERAGAARYLIAIDYTLLYIAALVGIWRQGGFRLRSPWAAAWLLAIALSLVHAVYWSNMRMRAPAIPCLAIAAAAALRRREQPARPTPPPDKRSFNQLSLGRVERQRGEGK